MGKINPDNWPRTSIPGAGPLGDLPAKPPIKEADEGTKKDFIRVECPDCQGSGIIPDGNFNAKPCLACEGGGARRTRLFTGKRRPTREYHGVRVGTRIVPFEEYFQDSKRYGH